MASNGGGEKRCLYEVLGVSRDATADDIRAAYKRQALQHHPDKAAAAGVPAETATARFQEIVNAYEVLSDARERAWYDSHRSQILFSNPRPSAASSGGDFSAAVDDLLPFFSNSVFSGFADSGKGFYKVYGDLFARVYSSELKFAAAMGMAAGSVRESPVIGNLESDYAQVTAFYGYWMGFCTVLDFAWVEEYESAAGWSRKARRAMEEENKKLRKKARREYNETVRGLAEFVKKRDKRVVEAAAKRRAEEEERKAKEKARKEAEAKLKAERVRAYQEEEWMAVEVEFDDEFEVEENSKKEDELYCVVCSKKFKSEKQWSNHEKSKKHKDKVAELRHAFEEEDHEEEEELDEGNEIVVDGDEVNGVCEELKKKGVIDEDAAVEVVDLVEEGDFDVEEDVLEEMISQQMRRNEISEQQQEIEPSSGNDQKDDANDSDLEEPTASSVKKKPRRRAKKEREVIITKTDPNGEAKLKSGSENVDEKQSHKSGRGNKPEGGKSAPKKDDNSRSKTQSKEKKPKGSMKTLSLGCDTCGETFESRNKLFAHLGDTGHAALKHR